MGIADQELQTARERPPQSDEIKTLVSKLNWWAIERMKFFPPKVLEAKARWEIVKAAKEDIHLGPLNEAEAKHQLEIVREQAEKLNVSSDSPISAERTDSITHQPFKTLIRREGNNWIAEEMLPDGIIISQAKIFDTGTTELTLHFTGQRYKDLGANPNLTVDSRFPRAAYKTFSLLAGTFKK